MDETKLKDFNVELNALLIKYGFMLQVQQGIIVVPRQPEPTAEVETEKVEAEVVEEK